MAETVEEAVIPEETVPASRLCLCEQYVRVTEGAALFAARWLGRADQEAAERDAAEAMRRVLDDFPIQGRVVIGDADEESPLRVGEDIGAGGESVDLALDPLEGRGVVARGGNGAMSMIAVGERGSLLKLPDMYIRKMAVGPRARGSIDLLKPVGENVHAIAESFGRKPNDITTIVLDRPRHHDLIEEIRASGARIKHGLDLRCDPRDERSPGDRDRRHPPGGDVGGGAPLSRRRASGAALADLAARDRAGA